MNRTEIISNGSTWNGQEDQTIDQLLAVIESEPLDPRFERYGNFAYRDDVGLTHFWGNFYTVSHVFHIDTTDEALAARLTAAIRANQSTPEYLEAREAQPWLT